MKKILSFLSVLLCFALLGCVEEYKPEECDPQKDYMLIAAGKKIGYVKYNEEEDYLEIPLVVVLEKLGVSIKWQSDDKAIVMISDNQYTLDTSKGTMTDDKFDYLNLPSLGLVMHNQFHKGSGRNFVVDSDNARNVMNLLDYRLQKDRDTRTAEYVSKDDITYSSNTISDYDIENIPSDHGMSKYGVEKYTQAQCDPEKDYKLIVRGEDLGYIKYNEEHQCVEVPLVVVLEKLDVPVVWQSATAADVVLPYGIGVYRLDTNAGTFTIDAKSTYNYLKRDSQGKRIKRPIIFKGTGENFTVDSGHIEFIIAILVNERMRVFENERIIKFGYDIDDFSSIVVGKSTYIDVHNIAPELGVQGSEYGVYLEYPYKNPKFRIEFVGNGASADSIVSKIEKIG